MFRSIALAALLIVASLSSAMAAGKPASPNSLKQFKAAIAGKTVMTYDPSHGTQVEFVGANGRNYLFYPGNRGIVPGQWKLTGGSRQSPVTMCFMYGANSYNPVTHVWGGQWECELAQFYVSHMVEVVDGDPLGLARRNTVPFVLGKAKTTIARLVAKAGH